MSPPRIWTTFSRIVNGKEVKFRIQEVEPEQYEHIMKLYLDYYVPEEPVHRTAGVMNTDEALEEYKEHYLRSCVSEHCQIDVCYLDDDSGALNIVAASIMFIDEKSKPWDGQKTSTLLKTEQTKTFFEMVIYMTGKYYKHVRDKLPDEVFYDDVGIVVHKDYRRLGIAGELFKAREITCKEHGVSALGAWMTTIGSQKAATKLGWDTALEVTYQDIGKIGGVTYKEAVPSAKYMIKKV